MTITIAQAEIFFLALTRITAMMIQVPVLGGQAIPNQVKVGLALLLTLVMMPVVLGPAVNAAALAPLPVFGLVLAGAREMLIGTLAGFSASLTFGVLQMTGELMGLGTGFGAGRVLNPTFDQAGSAIDQVFLVTTTLLFLILNGHHLFIQGMQQTFVAIAVNGPLPAFSVEPLIRLTAQMLAAGVLLATPILGSALLADVTLGLLARVAPQVHVFFLGAPLKVGIGLLTLTMALGIILPTAISWLSAIGPRMLVLLGA